MSRAPTRKGPDLESGPSLTTAPTKAESSNGNTAAVVADASTLELLPRVLIVDGRRVFAVDASAA